MERNSKYFLLVPAFSGNLGNPALWIGHEGERVKIKCR